MGAIIIGFLILISSLWITAVEEEGKVFFLQATFRFEKDIFNCKLEREPHQELNGPLMMTVNMSSTSYHMSAECSIEGYSNPDSILSELHWMKNGKIVPEEEVRRTTAQLPDRQTYVTKMIINVPF